MQCTNCGRNHGANEAVEVTCRCGQVVLVDATTRPIVTELVRAAIHEPDWVIERRKTCHACEHFKDGICLLLASETKRGAIEHHKGIHRRKSRCKDGRW